MYSGGYNMLALHSENIVRTEAIAYYKPILQAALEYKPHGFLPGTYGTRQQPEGIAWCSFNMYIYPDQKINNSFIRIYGATLYR